MKKLLAFFGITIRTRAAELERIEELAKQTRREEGAYYSDSLK